MVHGRMHKIINISNITHAKEVILGSQVTHGEVLNILKPVKLCF